MIDNYSQPVKYKEPLLLFHHEKGQLRNVSGEVRSGVRRRRFPRAAWPLAISTTTAASTCWWATMAARPFCCATMPGTDNHWLGVKLQGAKCNRDAVGARLTWSAGGVTRTRLKNNGGSYLSSHDMREVLGLGTAVKVDWLEVQWPQPSGRTERFTDLPVDRYITITEGKGLN